MQVTDLKAELGTELLAQLSAAERSELSKLSPQLKSLQVCTCTLMFLAILSPPSPSHLLRHCPGNPHSSCISLAIFINVSACRLGSH